MGQLQGKKVAVLATNGFEQSELLGPKAALQDAGAEVHVIAPQPGVIRGMQHDEKGEAVPVDRVLSDTAPDEYDALVLPGGVGNPDKLRVDEDAVDFVSHFVTQRKPIGAICHGPWTLIEVPDAVAGRTVTSWPSLRTDLSNAGAHWVDRDVVVDQGLVTSRNPADIPAFSAKLIEQIREGVDRARDVRSDEQRAMGAQPE